MALEKRTKRARWLRDPLSFEPGAIRLYPFYTTNQKLKWKGIFGVHGAVVLRSATSKSH